MAELGIDKSLIPYLDFQIYRNLLKMDMEKLAAKYDIIILDEYHRCGAKKWGIQVNKLFDFTIKNIIQIVRYAVCRFYCCDH